MAHAAGGSEMKINYLVVHCSDSPAGRGDDAETIHRWHKEKGWDGIGYHAVILENGTVQAGRPIYWTGAHCRGHNSDSLGVCLIGKGDYTERQFNALKCQLNQWLAIFPDANVVGHCDLDSRKQCPLFDVKKWWFNEMVS